MTTEDKHTKIAYLIAKITAENIHTQDLDTLVYGVTDGMASSINNAGLYAQLDFLLPKDPIEDSDWDAKTAALIQHIKDTKECRDNDNAEVVIESRPVEEHVADISDNDTAV